MGINGICKKWILDNFASCASFTRPGDVHLVSIDMMQYLKTGVLPDTIFTTRDLVKWIVNKITDQFDYRNDTNGTCMVVVANFDLGSPPVKKLVEHKKRYAVKRCDLCKTTDLFHERCENDCEGKQPLKYDPKSRGHFSKFDLDKEFPYRGDQWYRFCSDSRILRTELYPLIMNELLTTPPRRPNQLIIVNGLPARTCVLNNDELMQEIGYIPVNKEDRVRVVNWLPDELPLPMDESLFRTVFEVRWIQNEFENRIHITDCPHMKNDIHEADNAVFYFSQFFPKHNQMIVINDGDAIPIGLLRCAEDFRGGPEPTHTTYLCLPYKRDKHLWQQKFGDKGPPKYEYINLTKLYAEISGYQPFISRGVQNPVVTVVFLIILGNTDFFKNFCPGIGLKTNWNADPAKQKRQKNGIWDTFFCELEHFTHLVQWYTLDMHHNPSAKRRIVIDEKLFRMFTYKCHFHKYRKNKPHNDLKELAVHCSKLKNGFPSREKIQVWCRNISWNLQYWVNACRDIYIDPFERIDGQPYWGFDPKVGVTASVYPKQKPVDRVHERHFYDKKTKNRSGGAVLSARKKRKIVKELGDEINEL